MALNLTREAFDAVDRLKSTPEWQAFVEALEAQMSHFMHAAIEPAENHADSAGYARCLRDIVAFIHQAQKGAGTRVARPNVKVRESV